VDPQVLAVSLHERRRARRMEDPAYQAAYEQSAREISQTDAVIRALDALRTDLGVSKAELARRVNRNASSVRRLFTANQVRPELPLIVALADALGAELRLVPRTSQARRAVGEHRRQRRVAIKAEGEAPTVGCMAPRNADPSWVIVYYLTPEGAAPALEFLDTCPSTIDAQFTGVLDAVAAAPPPQFSGEGKWEAMHGVMGGWYEIRLTGPGREQFRLFCLLENGPADRGYHRHAQAMADNILRSRLQTGAGPRHRTPAKLPRAGWLRCGTSSMPRTGRRGCSLSGSLKVSGHARQATAPRSVVSDWHRETRTGNRVGRASLAESQRWPERMADELVDRGIRIRLVRPRRIVSAQPRHRC
jgi:transcriptional regulator with XRE-family HTH domain